MEWLEGFQCVMWLLGGSEFFSVLLHSYWGVLIVFLIVLLRGG